MENHQELITLSVHLVQYKFFTICMSENIIKFNDTKFLVVFFFTRRISAVSGWKIGKYKLVNSDEFMRDNIVCIEYIF